LEIAYERSESGLWNAARETFFIRNNLSMTQLEEWNLWQILLVNWLKKN